MKDSATFFNKNLDHLKERFKGEAETRGLEWEDQPAIMKAGQVVFHHCLTFHGSGPNLSPHPRNALAIHMQGKDCGYRSGKGWHHNIRDMGPELKEGDLFVGPAFPTLYSS